MKRVDLITIAEDLNEEALLGLDPPIDTSQKTKDKELVEQILEAVTFIEPDDKIEEDTKRLLGEFVEEHSDEFTEKQVEVFVEIGLTETEEDKEPEEAQEPTLEEEVEDAQTLKQLKDIVKANDEFKPLRGVITKYKTAKDLKDVMLDVLSWPAEGKETEKKPKVEEVEAEEIGSEEEYEALMLRNNARNELMQIKDLETGVEYLNKVKSIQVWVNAEKKDAELQNLVAEQKLRTQRILGNLISEGQEKGKIASQKTGRKSVTEDDTYPEKLNEIGITRNQSSVFKKIASIPDKEFEEFIQEKKENVKQAVNELTTAGALKLAKKRSQKISETQSKSKSNFISRERKDEIKELADKINTDYNKREKEYFKSLLK